MAGILLRPSFLLLLSAYVVTNLNLDGIFPLWFCKLSRTTAKKKKEKRKTTKKRRDLASNQCLRNKFLSPKNRTFRKLWNCPHISNSATMSWAWVIYRHLANYMWKVVIVMTESRYRPCCKQEERGCFQKNHDHNTTTQQIKLISLLVPHLFSFTTREIRSRFTAKLSGHQFHSAPDGRESKLSIGSMLKATVLVTPNVKHCFTINEVISESIIASKLWLLLRNARIFPQSQVQIRRLLILRRLTSVILVPKKGIIS